MKETIMNREVPFDTNALCDECGEVGAFDFMGDLICAKCLEKSNDLDWADLLGRAIKFCEQILKRHRDKVMICCPEDCWCWDIEQFIDDYERWLEQ